MSYTKYLIAKTGWFPRWEPVAEDVLAAAEKVFEIKDVITDHRERYFYVIPERQDALYLRDMVSVFKANGIVLRPHKSKHYGCLLFRVPNRGQRFMYDVMRVRNDVNEFQKVLAEYEARRQDKKVLFPKLFQMVHGK